MSDDGIFRKEWLDGRKTRAAYIGAATHGRLPGVGAFIIISDDSASLEMLWDIVVGGCVDMDKDKVKTVGVCSIEHINEMAGEVRP